MPLEPSPIDRARIESDALYRSAELLRDHGFHQAAWWVAKWSAEGVPDLPARPTDTRTTTQED